MNVSLIKTVLLASCLNYSLGFGQSTVEIPELLNGDTPQRILREKNIGRPSGYAIFEFWVNMDGSVDSIKIQSKYYKEEDYWVKSLDKRDYETIANFKFKPVKTPVRIQHKLYLSLYNNRFGYEDITRPNKWDYLQMFYYGFQELHENEIKTYFTDEKGGGQEYIIKNNTIIIAPGFLRSTS